MVTGAVDLGVMGRSMMAVFVKPAPTRGCTPWKEFTMILEHADIHIDPARAAAFEADIVRGVSTVISQAKGFQGYKINRSIETPGRYLLMIYWDSLEDHTVGFRGSEAFAEWRAIVGPYFAQPPVVEHLELVSKSS